VWDLRALVLLGLLALLGCSTPGNGPARSQSSRNAEDQPMFNRDAFTNVYERVVLPYDSQRQGEIDDLTRASDVNFVRLFLDDRHYAIVTPKGPGIRGANGNGPFLLYQYVDDGWCFVHEFGGYEYQVQPDLKAPGLVTLERVSTDVTRRNIEKWNGARFELVTSGLIEYPGE